MTGSFEYGMAQFKPVGPFQLVGSFEPVMGHLILVHFIWNLFFNGLHLSRLSSFDMVGPFEPVESIDMVRPFQPVYSFDMVRSFEPGWVI